MLQVRSLLVFAVLAAAPFPAYSITCEYCETQYTVCTANGFMMGDAAYVSACYTDWIGCTVGTGLVCTGPPGGSSGASPQLTEDQMQIITQCSDALDAVNTQGLDFISSAELEAQVNVWAEVSCPDTLSANGVMDISEYTDLGVFFQGMSCALCTGLIDPSSIQGDMDSCGCNGPASAAPSISINDLTELEAVMYCFNVVELVATECIQPEPSCYQGCVAQENECISNTCMDLVNESDFYLQCWDACVLPKVACIADCGAVVSVPTNQVGSNGGGGGSFLGGGGTTTNGNPGTSTNGSNGGSFLGGGGGTTNGNPGTSTNGNNGGGGGFFLGGGGGTTTSTSTTNSASSGGAASFKAFSFGATVLASTLLMVVF